MLDVTALRPGPIGRPAAPPPRYDLDGIVTALRVSRDETHNIRHGGRVRPMPSRDAMAGIVADLSVALFPSHFGQSESGVPAFDGLVAGTLATALQVLEQQVRRGLAFAPAGRLPPAALDAEALAITRGFARALPGIRGLLVGDLGAALDGDPAASSAPEILLGYPGMMALIHHRLAHALHGLGAQLPARLIADIARERTGVDIHPAARIGERLFIDHGTGVVIGETAIVGRGVRLHQGVTLGARHAPTAAELKDVARHPVIGDNVVICAGAAVLGRVTVGSGSVIGGNVCLTASVPPGSRVAQAAPLGGGEARPSGRQPADP